MRVAVISDIHSNLQALDAVMTELDSDPPDAVLCAGDIVGYGANPNECCEIVSRRCDKIVVGNHDLSALTGDTYLMNPYAARASVWTSAALSRVSRSFLESLPREERLGLGGARIAMYHGSPRSVSEYVYEDDLEGLPLDEIQAEIVIMGHTHVPYVRKLGRVLAVNPGSVGQPRDSDPRASFAVLEPAAGRCLIRRLDYDTEGAAKAIISAGLPQLLAERLFCGM